MSHKISLTPSGEIFEAQASETILEAAIKAGITIPYGCQNGSCGSCKAKIISGKVFLEGYQSSALHDSEVSEGWTLCCKALATEDIVMETRSARDDGLASPKITPVRVEILKQLNHDVMKMVLKLPGNEAIDFRAGQYLEFLMQDGSRRAFSIASAPHEPLIELHLRLIEGGKFTHHVFNEMQEKTIHRIEAPLGQFYLRESDKPIVFVSGGTGFAPIKSVIEGMIHAKNSRPIYLYQGVRAQADLYMNDVCMLWENTHSNIKYIPVFSDPSEEDDKAIRRGLVHVAVMEDFETLSNVQVYCCGAPILVETAYQEFTQKKSLPENEFYADAFSFSPKK
jgi:CDP-4-dehydro-6-deoxyglucose reductase, E3